MTQDQFKRAAGISDATARRWYNPLNAAMADFGIDTPKRQAAFIAQVGHESGGFTVTTENMNYSVEGLMITFPRTRISAESCRELGRRLGEKTVPLDRQERIAALVYGGRYGNDTKGDGWRYRGRGLKQITFYSNYLACGAALGLDLSHNPELLTLDVNAARSAAWFWSANGCSALADAGDFVGLTKRINGGTNGLVDRKARWEVAKKVLMA